MAEGQDKIVGVEKVKVLRGHYVGKIIKFYIKITKPFNSDSVKDFYSPRI